MEYFGTSTTEHGHYRWSFTKEGTAQKVWQQFDDLPFHPENLTNNLPKGEVVFYQSNEYTVIAIAGSCVDERPGTKSVFWIRKKLTYDEMYQEIVAHPAALAILSKMKFKVKW